MSGVEKFIYNDCSFDSICSMCGNDMRDGKYGIILNFRLHRTGSLVLCGACTDTVVKCRTEFLDDEKTKTREEEK